MTDRRPDEPPALVVRGGVEHGDQRGRALGFPTANLAITDDALLDGVWAGWVEHRRARHAAAISVGSRPTFYGRHGFRLREAHLLDFDGDLYDEVVDVWLVHRLRGQRRFAGVADLTAQLAPDVAATRAWAATATVHRTHIGDALLTVPLGIPVPIARTA